jgi:hypothetical protein
MVGIYVRYNPSLQKNSHPSTLSLSVLIMELEGFDGGIVMIDGPVATDQQSFDLLHYFLCTSSKGMLIKNELFFYPPPKDSQKALRENRRKKHKPVFHPATANIVLGG